MKNRMIKIVLKSSLETIEGYKKSSTKNFLCIVDAKVIDEESFYKIDKIYVNKYDISYFHYIKINDNNKSKILKIKQERK